MTYNALLEGTKCSLIMLRGVPRLETAGGPSKLVAMRMVLQEAFDENRKKMEIDCLRFFVIFVEATPRRRDRASASPPKESF